MQVQDSSGLWKPWKTGTQGKLLYDNNRHVSLHLTINNYGNYKTEFNNFDTSITLKSLKHLTNNYNYMGFYRIKDSIVEHTKLTHSNPKEWGSISQRKFWFVNDTLFMQPLENKKLMLKWLKIKN